MGNAYLILWSKDRIRNIRKYHQEGSQLEVLFGGPHSSEPSFHHYGIKEGDTIYPVRVDQGVIYILGQMKVKQLISLEEYIEQNPELFAEVEKQKIPMLTLQSYLSLHPEKQYLAPTCTEEVALGEEGTPIRLDIQMPSEMLERLRFRSQRKERSLKYIENGRLLKAISLQGGYYRLTESSAQEVEALLMKAYSTREIG